jgi:hypothetical protein
VGGPPLLGQSKHPLVSVVVIAILAVLAGAGGPTAIVRWAALKEEFLLQMLDLPGGVPGKDVFRRVLTALKPTAFRACFTGWLQSLRAEATAATGAEQPILPVDGKTARRSHDRRNGLGALHSVSIWASEFGLSLGQAHVWDETARARCLRARKPLVFRRFRRGRPPLAAKFVVTT